MRQVPDGIGVVGIGGEIAEEDVEVRHVTLVAFLVLESAGHGVRDDLCIGADILGLRENLDSLHAVGIVVLVEPLGGTQQCLDDTNCRIGILLRELLVEAEDLLGVVLPDLVVSDDRYTDTLEDSLLVPGLADAIAVDGACLQGCRHLRRRCYGEQRLCVDGTAGVTFFGRVEARVDAAGRQPVAKLVVVRRDREDHAHLEGLALFLEFLDNWLQIVRLDRVNRLAVIPHRDMFFHLLPDLVGDGDTVTVEVHRKGSDDMRLCAETDGGRKRLACQHVRTVELAVNDTIQKHFPVGLRFQRDIESLVLEIALFIGNGQGRHVGELDEPEFQVLFFRLAEFCRCGRGQCRCAEHDRACRRGRHHPEKTASLDAVNKTHEDLLSISRSISGSLKQKSSGHRG